MRNKALLLIFLSFIAKGILFYFFWKCYNTDHRLYIFTGDSLTYINYTENLLSKGTYFVQDEGQTFYAFRMPGLLFFYLPLRLFLSQHLALSALVILQIICSAISTYYLAKLACRLTGYTALFWPVFIVASVCPYTANYNNLVMTESFSISLLIFSLYLLTKKEASATHYVLAGLFFAVVIFLRPYMAPIWLLLAIMIYFLGNSQTTRAALKNCLLFMIPFMLMDGIWVVRNFITMHQFVPLQTSTEWYKGKYKSREAKVAFIQDFGFNWIGAGETPWGWLSTDAENKRMGITRPGDDIFPPRTFSGDLTIDSLRQARTLIACAENENTDSSQRKICDTEAARIINKFISNLKANKPLDYYLLNRVRVSLSFIHQTHSLGYPTKNLAYRLGWVVNKMDTVINYFVIYFGFIGLMLTLKIRSYKILLAVIPLYTVFLFGFVYRAIEFRFLAIAYPFLLVDACLLLVFVAFKTGILKEKNATSN